MNFSQQLTQKLENAERAKDFAKSSYTQRIEKMAPFQINQEAEDLLISCVVAMFLIFTVGFVVNQIFGDLAAGITALTLLSAPILYGVFGGLWLPYTFKKWCAKAQKLGLSTDGLYQAEGFRFFKETMAASSQLEVITQCEHAGATAQQLKRLYELTEDDLPYVWWENLAASAKATCAKHKKDQQIAAKRQAEAQIEHLAREEIARRMENVEKPQEKTPSDLKVRSVVL